MRDTIARTTVAQTALCLAGAMLVAAAVGDCTVPATEAALPPVTPIQGPLRPVLSWPEVGQGDSGETVTSIQYLLREHGLDVEVDIGHPDDQATRSHADSPDRL